MAGEQAVGADDDGERAVAQAVEQVLLLGAALEAGEDVDGDRVVGHPLGEGEQVLLGEDGGGDEDGDLLALDGGLDPDYS